MANTTTIRITHPETAAQMDDLVRVGDAKVFLSQLQKFLDKVQSGSSAGNVSVTAHVGGTAGVKASATATCASVIATDTIIIGGTTLTAVADNTASPTAVQFKISSGGGAGQNAGCATNLAACINANTTLNKYVVATAAAAIVTITMLNAGVVGNKVTLTTTGGTIAVTGSGFFTSGAGDDVAGTTYSFA